MSQIEADGTSYNSREFADSRAQWANRANLPESDLDDATQRQAEETLRQEAALLDTLTNIEAIDPKRIQAKIDAAERLRFTGYISRGVYQEVMTILRLTAAKNQALLGTEKTSS